MEREARFSIRISPELRRLRGKASPPEHPLPEAEPEPELEAAPEPVLVQPAPEPERPPEAPGRPRGALQRLRRDGARPLCFEGLPILSMALGPARVALAGKDSAGQLALYLASDGRIAAQIRGRSEKFPARPVFRAEWISDPAELSQMLRSSGQDPARSRPRAPGTPSKPRSGTTGPDPVTRA